VRGYDDWASVVEELTRQYNDGYTSLYPERKVVEKGERLYVDDFLTIASDFA